MGTKLQTQSREILHACNVYRCTLLWFLVLQSSQKHLLSSAGHWWRLPKKFHSKCIKLLTLRKDWPPETITPPFFKSPHPAPSERTWFCVIALNRRSGWTEWCGTWSFGICALSGPGGPGGVSSHLLASGKSYQGSQQWLSSSDTHGGLLLNQIESLSSATQAGIICSGISLWWFLWTFLVVQWIREEKHVILSSEKGPKCHSRCICIYIYCASIYILHIYCVYMHILCIYGGLSLWRDSDLMTGWAIKLGHQPSHSSIGIFSICISVCIFFVFEKIFGKEHDHVCNIYLISHFSIILSHFHH